MAKVLPAKPNCPASRIKSSDSHPLLDGESRVVLSPGAVRAIAAICSGFPLARFELPDPALVPVQSWQNFRQMTQGSRPLLSWSSSDDY